jgi:hypothetical protein
MTWRDYLPNFKESLNSFYDEKLKDAFEQKSNEYKGLFTKHLDHWYNTQKVLVVIALGIFALLAIAYFWPNEKK